MGFKLKTMNNQLVFESFGDRVICGDDKAIKKGKPEPDIFLEAAKRFFNHDLKDTGNILVFEDSPSGCLAAIKGGMKCIWVPDRNLEIEESLAEQVSDLIYSLEDFQPEKYGLPAFIE